MRIRLDDLSGGVATIFRRDAEDYVPWRLVTPRATESCRWQSSDGRWVALTLGRDGEIGNVVVTDSKGRRELVDSYEGALELAKSWRY